MYSNVGRETRFLVTSVFFDFGCFQNDVDATKAAPVLNSNADGTSAPKPISASMDDSEMKKLMDECKRLQYDVGKLSDENRQLKVWS